MHRDARRRPPGPLLTFALPVVLAGVLGTIVYFAVTSLPYLISSPTTDPTFGALNECLLGLVPKGRVGFAVSRDATRVAAFSSDLLAACASEGAPHRTWRLSGATAAAWDGEGRLWVAVRSGDAGATHLLLLDGDAPREMGEVSPQLLVGTPAGVVALEPPGRLVAMSADGHVGGVVDLPPVRDAQLSVSADGRRIALVTSGGFFVFDALTLAKIRAEAPCVVEYLWWLREGHRAVVTCGPASSWALSLDVDTGAHEVASGGARVQSVLAGPGGPWVQPCDVLPCTAVEP